MGGKQITLENFVAGAIFQTLGKSKMGFTQIGREIYEGRKCKGMCPEKQLDEKCFLYENGGKRVCETFTKICKSFV